MTEKIHVKFEAYLQVIETVVINFYLTHPELTDAAVDNVYEELARRYRAEATNHEFKPGKLDGMREALHAELLPQTERMLGRTELPRGWEALTPEDLRLCLNRLRKSITLWTREGGRQGYLKYLQQFL